MGNSNNFFLSSINVGVKWWAESVLDQRIVVWDFETTGLSKKDVPVELAIVDGFSGATLYQSLIYTNQPIHPKAQEVHKITKDMLVGCPEFWRVVEYVREIFEGNYSATYNAPFDVRIWEQGAGEPVPGKVWCLMDAYRMYANLPKKVNLSSALKQMGIGEMNTHRAEADAQAAAALLRKMAQGVIPNLEVDLIPASIEINPKGDNDFVKPPVEELIFRI
jgi:DNA polymerase III epsilon subunit-like protein